MADRYWVGGTGTWNTTSTTNWSATSGGAGGASAPTSIDNVFINANSGTGIITLGSSVGAFNINFTGYTGTLNGSFSDLDAFGSLTLSSGMTISSQPRFRFRAADSGSYTFDSAGLTVGNVAVFPGSSTAQLTLTSPLTATGYINQAFGTFNTGNFNINCSQFLISGNNTRTVNCGSSTITLTGNTPIDVVVNTGLTFNAGTSTIICTSGGTLGFQVLGLTLYNVSFTGGGTSTITISGSATYNNLSVTSNTSGVKTINFANNQTINGTLSVSGTSATNRVQFSSSVTGTQRTLSVATIGTLTNTNWRDIALTGAASPWTAPIGVVDLKNNTGITFDTTPLYWVGGAGTWTDATKWSTSSGGAGGAGVPGSTNNVTFDANSGTGTVSGNSGSPPNYCANFDCSLTSTSTSFSGLWLYTYGNLKLKSGVANSFVIIQFSGTGTHTIDPNGATAIGAGGGFTINGSGTFTLINNWVSGNAFNHSAGTFNTNGYSLSTNAFTIDTATTKVLNLGASTITINGTSGFGYSGSNLTFNAGTSTITTTGGLNAGSGLTFYNVILDNATTVIRGANTYNNLTFTAPTSAGINAYIPNDTQTINGTLTASGSNGNRRILIAPFSVTSQYTLNAAAVSLTDVDFVSVIGAGAASWTGTRLGNGGNNSGITFTAPKTVYWSLAAGGNAFTATGWATSSGGTPATTNFPLGQDTAIVEDTGLNSGATLTYSTLYTVLPNLTFATRTLPVTLALSTSVYIPSNITLSSAVTRSGLSLAYFSGNTTLTTAGVTWTNQIGIFGSLTIADTTTINNNTISQIYAGSLTLNAPLTFSASGINFQIGTISLNSFTLTARTFTSDTSNTRVIQFGTGNITITGSGTAFNMNGTGFTYTGTPTVNISNNSATATTVTANAGFSETTALNFNFTTGTYSLTFSAAIVKNLNFTGFAGTIDNSNRTIYGNLTVPASGVTWSGTSTQNFSATSGTQTITTNGATIDVPFTFNGAGGTREIAGDLTLGSTRALNVERGIFNTNNFNVTVGLFNSTYANTRTINMGSGTWTITGVGAVWNIQTITNLTFNPGASTIVLSNTSTTARTFHGGSLTYNNLTIGGTTGTSTLTFTGSNTFNTLSSTKTVAHTILFTASTTNTFTNFNINGTAGNIVTISSVSTSSHTLAKAGGGTVTVDYASISRSTATPTLTWLATNSTDGGNNSGWYFGAFPAPSGGNYFLLF